MRVVRNVNRDADVKTETGSKRSRVDWLGVFACVAVGCFILAVSWFKLSSLDTGYHLAYGNHFIETGEIVEVDPYLYPETATPFINANWGSQVVMAAVERVGGAAGLVVLRLLLIASVFLCIALILRRAGASALWISVAWLIAGITAYERFSLRPELFSYAIMLVMLVLLVYGIRRWRGVIVLAVLQVLWVNLHSYFLVGVLMVAAWTAGEVLRWLRARPLGDDTSGTQAEIDSPASPESGVNSAGGASSASSASPKFIVVGLLVLVAACMVNPWHYRGATFPVGTLKFLHGEDVMGGAAGDPPKSAWSEISEFQSPFSFGDQPICSRTIHAYYAMLVLGGIGVLILLRRGHTGPAMVLVLFFAMSTQMRRNIAQFAIVAAPLSVAALAAIRMPDDATLRRIGRSLLFVVAVGASCWWTHGIVTGRFYYTERRIAREFGHGYSERTFAKGAAEWLAGQDLIEPNLFVDYFTSSNALPWLPERFKLFVDTNTFAVSDETLGTAFDLGLGTVDKRAFFDKHGVNVVLLHCGPDTEKLVRELVIARTEWSLVYCDPHHVVFVRRTVPHIPVILENEITGEDIDVDRWIADTIEGGPYRALSLGTMASVPLTLGWHEKAEVLFVEAVRAAPDYYEGWTNLGLCRGMAANVAIRNRKSAETIVAKLESAEACFRRSLAIRPGYEIAAANLERVQSQLRPVRGP